MPAAQWTQSKSCARSNQGLDQNAVDAARKWKFAPATKDGRPVAVQFESTVGFRLN
jgi:TonB family protein